jgi:hypothetical protein
MPNYPNTHVLENKVAISASSNGDGFSGGGGLFGRGGGGFW